MSNLKKENLYFLYIFNSKSYKKIPEKDLLQKSEITYKVILADLIYLCICFPTSIIKKNPKLQKNISKSKRFVHFNLINIELYIME